MSLLSFRCAPRYTQTRAVTMTHTLTGTHTQIPAQHIGNIMKCEKMMMIFLDHKMQMSLSRLSTKIVCGRSKFRQRRRTTPQLWVCVYEGVRVASTTRLPVQTFVWS